MSKRLDDEELRHALEQLPCCTRGPDLKTPGDPLNIVIIGSGLHTFIPFVRSGWDPTETLSRSSVWRTIASSLSSDRYRTSPISPLFFFARQQDVALQKAHVTVDERYHLRVWLTPLRYQGMDVWIGQISWDIGVRVSSKTFVTHKIDLGACAAKPLMSYSADTPPLVLVPAPYAGIQDQRARFREIFCAVLEARARDIPDYHPAMRP